MCVCVRVRARRVTVCVCVCVCAACVCMCVWVCGWVCACACVCIAACTQCVSVCSSCRVCTDPAAGTLSSVTDDSDSAVNRMLAVVCFVWSATIVIYDACLLSHVTGSPSSQFFSVLCRQPEFLYNYETPNKCCSVLLIFIYCCCRIYV